VRDICGFRLAEGPLLPATLVGSGAAPVQGREFGHFLHQIGIFVVQRAREQAIGFICYIGDPFSPMIDWILANQVLFNAGVSALTVIIWVIYAQLLYFGFRRQRTPRMLINRGRKKNLDALCIISNMSQEAIYVEYIIATLKTSRGTVIMDVTDFEQDPTEEREDENGNRQMVSVVPPDLRENTRQGPLLSGEFMHIGTFKEVVKRLTGEADIPMRGSLPDADIELESLTIELIALYGPEPRPVNARRKFKIKSDENSATLVPTSWQTQHGISFLRRRRLSKIVDEMNETNFSMSSTIRWDDD
jgi:hypothetical protein